MTSDMSRFPALSAVRVIVTDADSRLGLHVIRALGQAGCVVTALAATSRGGVLGFSSRYTSKAIELPPGDYEDVLVPTIEGLGGSHDVVVPVSALSILLLQRNLHSIESELRTFLPPPEAFDVAVDKRATTNAAERAGIPVPRTYHDLDPNRPDDWAATMQEHLPLVIKFADEKRSGSWHPGDRYQIVRSIDELRTEYRRFHKIGGPPLVQEYVEGDGCGFFTIFGPSGDPFVTFCHRRLREYPISGGPSTLCESIHDPILVDLGTRLLKALNWRGVAMVEFKQDRKTGEYKLLEINPRFWGSLPLAIQSGINFPAYQVQMALGQEAAPPGPYPLGKKMRFFLPDLLAVVDQWRTHNKKSVIRSYVSELLDLSIKDGLFDLRDPMPFVTYVRRNIKR